MKTNKTTIRFETQIETPTARQKIVVEAISHLPESNPHGIRELEVVLGCLERLCAIEKLHDEAKKNLIKASTDLNAYVQKQWKPEEIPKGTKMLLNVWGHW